MCLVAIKLGSKGLPHFSVYLCCKLIVITPDEGQDCPGDQSLMGPWLITFNLISY